MPITAGADYGKSSYAESSGLKLSKVDIPSWDGQEKSLAQRKLDVRLLESSGTAHEQKQVANTFIGEFTGTVKQHFLVDPGFVGSAKFQTTGGHWEMIEHMAKARCIFQRQGERANVFNFFYELQKKTGDFLRYQNREERAHRELPEATRKADPFQQAIWFIPDRLRGVFFLQ